MIRFTRSLAREWPQSVCELHRAGGVQTENEGRVATQEEIARIVAQQAASAAEASGRGACVSLSSEWSDGIIGQTINVDGGAVMK
jgi:enoyl-[acyl-carrier-protein] reductase (NADH)